MKKQPPPASPELKKELQSSEQIAIALTPGGWYFVLTLMRAGREFLAFEPDVEDWLDEWQPELEDKLAAKLPNAISRIKTLKKIFQEVD